MSDVIEILLLESELQDDLVLRELLGELEREATAVRPMPSAALRDVMGASRSTRRRSPGSRRAVITGIVVIGALAVGTSAAAASPDVRSAISVGFAAVAHLFDPGSATKPTGPKEGTTASPGVSDSSRQPTGATPSPSDTEPKADDSSGHGGTTSGSDSSGDQNSQGSNSGTDSGTDSGSNSGSNSGNSGSDSSNSGSGNSGDSNSGDSSGNGSGHGNGKGKGNGGPALTP